MVVVIQAAATVTPAVVIMTDIAAAVDMEAAVIIPAMIIKLPYESSSSNKGDDRGYSAYRSGESGGSMADLVLEVVALVVVVMVVATTAFNKVAINMAII
ncbi:unnamed protein product [Absidia cylindrospora]